MLAYENKLMVELECGDGVNLMNARFNPSHRDVGLSVELSALHVNMTFHKTLMWRGGISIKL